MGAHDETISVKDYARLCELIYAQAGIHLGTERKTMLESRIKRRLKALSFHSYSEYCNYLFGPTGLKDELIHLIDVVTTNKTDFFREPKHFDFLVEKALPEMAERINGRNFIIWSAGCSTGEEPYTMAVVLSEYAAAHPGFRFRILASDISNIVLSKAELGVYTQDIIAPVSPWLRRKYFMRSRKPGSEQVRVVPELRRAVEFRRLNFMDSDYGMSEKADAIFCRNVIIYFDRQTQERILQKLSSYLLPGGYMFVGHAETLHDMKLPLVPVAPALYRRVDG
ncbi:MAG: protein-glutamate O-methyltransferase [Terracidiphilus sp.]|jgi:chemotaxis protein methyltransferase CheR